MQAFVIFTDPPKPMLPFRIPRKVEQPKAAKGIKKERTKTKVSNF
jgi:hypothetical protein